MSEKKGPKANISEVDIEDILLRYLSMLCDDSVRVSKTESAQTIIFTIDSVNSADRGMIIGRGGSNIVALRKIINNLTKKHISKSALIEIKE